MGGDGDTHTYVCTPMYVVCLCTVYTTHIRLPDTVHCLEVWVDAVGHHILH